MEPPYLVEPPYTEGNFEGRRTTLSDFFGLQDRYAFMAVP